QPDGDTPSAHAWAEAVTVESGGMAPHSRLLRGYRRRHVGRPAVPVGNRPELDPGDLVEEALGDLPELAVADRDRIAALEQQLADADDRRRRPGREGLGHVAGADLVGDFVDVDVGLRGADT